MTHNFAKSIIKMVPKWIQFLFLTKMKLFFMSIQNIYIHFLYFLRDHMNTQYKVLVDVTAVDYPIKAFTF